MFQDFIFDEQLRIKQGLLIFNYQTSNFLNYNLYDAFIVLKKLKSSILQHLQNITNNKSFVSLMLL